MKILNVKSSGIIEEVAPEKKAFNARRSLLVDDSRSQIIWIIHGKSVSQKTRVAAELSSKKLNASYGFTYKIISVPEQDRSSFIDSVVNGISPQIPETVSTPHKRQKRKTVPPTPSLDLKSVPVPGIEVKKRSKKRYRADSDTGPMLQEFMISYYDDHPIERINEGIKFISDDKDLEILADHIELISLMIAQNYDAKEAEKQLKLSLKRLIEIFK